MSNNIISILDGLIKKAAKMRASDIHIEPRNDKIDVRFRKDGRLIQDPPLTKDILPQIISRIKIISNLDISEQRLPQDGRTFMAVDQRELDLRVSVIPTYWGEKAVIRLLDRQDSSLSLEVLGMNPEQMSIYQKELTKSRGMILVTGPTGSGKTTTLYASLNLLDRSGQNIITIEDPIEYQIPGINQIQVNDKCGLTFARGLRSVLRQDPDIIMVGEIRDKETAEIAVRAAMTGHLVLSTLHTNSAIDAIGRLTDIGIEPYLLAASLNCIIAQRLVRKTGVSGCDGRTGVFEVLRMDGKIRDAAHDRARSSELLRLARLNGFRTLQESGERLANEGLTTREELIRVLTL